MIIIKIHISDFKFSSTLGFLSLVLSSDFLLQLCINLNKNHIICFNDSIKLSFLTGFAQTLKQTFISEFISFLSLTFLVGKFSFEKC